MAAEKDYSVAVIRRNGETIVYVDDEVAVKDVNSVTITAARNGFNLTVSSIASEPELAIVAERPRENGQYL